MSAQFTDDDVGKTVVNANGEDVGIVAAIEHGTAHVEPDPGMFETIKAKLGWEGSGDESYPLQETAVAEITDDHIRLEGDLSGVGGTAGTETGMDTDTSATGTGTETDTGMRDDDDDLIGDDTGMRDDDDLIGDDTGMRDDDDDLIGDDTGMRDDDDDLIGDDDDEGLIGDDDDDLIGDDDDEGLIGDDDDESLGDDDRDRDRDDVV